MIFSPFRVSFMQIQKSIFRKSLVVLYSILLFLTASSLSAFGHDKLGKDEDLGNAGAVFVSLGSVCIPAGYVSESGLRTCGYMPFDWICSKDGEKLIEIIKDDFRYFFNREYYLPYRDNPRKDNNLLHTYYHFEFVHDPEAVEDLMNKLFPKYMRRIERFRQLSNYRGKVIFIRYASGFDADCYWQFPENEEISDLYSLRLYNALKERFPRLDFQLVILNRGYNEIIEEEIKISDHVWKIRFNPGMSRYNPHGSQPEVRVAFRKLLLKLLPEELQQQIQHIFF